MAHDPAVRHAESSHHEVENMEWEHEHGERERPPPYEEDPEWKTQACDDNEKTENDPPAVLEHVKVREDGCGYGAPDEHRVRPIEPTRETKGRTHDIIGRANIGLPGN